MTVKIITKNVMAGLSFKEMSLLLSCIYFSIRFMLKASKFYTSE